MNTNEKLKPCPFCGSEKVGIYIDDGGDSGHVTYDVSCESCSGNVVCCEAEADAIAAWNARVDNTDDKIEKLKASIREAFRNDDFKLFDELIGAKFVKVKSISLSKALNLAHKKRG